MTMLRGVLFCALLFTFLANTCITGLTIKAKCQVKTFSCPCDGSDVSRANDLGEVSVTRCVTEGDLSKDVVCKSADVVTKCHEMIGKLQTRTRDLIFTRKLLLSFLSYYNVACQKLQTNWVLYAAFLNNILYQLPANRKVCVRFCANWVVWGYMKTVTLISLF